MTGSEGSVDRVQIGGPCDSPIAGPRAGGSFRGSRDSCVASSACRRAGVHVLVLVCLYSMCGCSRTPTRPTEPGLTPPRAPLLEELVQEWNSAKSCSRIVQARLSLGVQRDPHGPVRSCRGQMLLGAQKELYLRGDKPLLPTLFTLVSDGTNFWLSVPRENTVYTGPLEAGAAKSEQYGIGLNLRDLFRALLPCPIEDDRLVELDSIDSGHLLTVYEAAGTGRKPYRRLWLAGKPLRVQSEKYYGADGAEELEIQRSDFLESSGCLFPQEITLRSSTGSVVTMTFHEVRINPELRQENLFHFEMPAGVALKTLD